MVFNVFLIFLHTEFELFKLSPQANLTDSIKSFYTINKTSVRTLNIVFELDIYA